MLEELDRKEKKNKGPKTQVCNCGCDFRLPGTLKSHQESGLCAVGMPEDYRAMRFSEH